MAIIETIVKGKQQKARKIKVYHKWKFIAIKIRDMMFW